MKKSLFFLSLFIAFTAFSQNELPNVTLSTLDGESVNLTDIAKNDEISVISLWATWCVPCLKELDAINHVYADWQAETNVKLYAISIDDSRTVSRVRPLVNGKDWDYSILLDTNNDAKRALGAATVPVTFIIKNNKIVYQHSGYSPGAEQALYEKIQEFSKM